MHYPVMAGEVMEYLAVRPDGQYLDATTGMGGHTERIVRQLDSGSVIANDRDAESLELARKRLEPWKEKILFHHGSFSELESGMTRLGVGRVDGLVADLGLSMAQLTDKARGFSFDSDSLDGRMDRSRGQTAADFLNHITESDLKQLLVDFGEGRTAKRTSKAIVRARPIRSARHLADIVKSASPWAHSRIHPATRVLMAVRIAVNQELEELDALLEAIPRLVKSGGRAVFLTFHSTEDRLAKFGLRSLARDGLVRILTKHVVKPSEDEVRENPPSRSAKLRAVEVN